MMAEPAKKSLDAEAASTRSAAVAEEVLAIVTAVSRDLRPGRPPAPVGLDTVLDRELGLDSLARVELASRIEAAFEMALPDQVFAAAERAADLVEAILSAADAGDAPARRGERGGVRAEATTPASALAAPPTADTLGAVLAWHAARHGTRAHLRLWEDDGDGEVLTYGELFEDARAVASGLQAAGILPGETVAIMLPTCRAYFVGFSAILLSGAIAVPIYPPMRSTRIEEHVQRHVRILDNAQARALIVPREAEPLARLVHAQVQSLRLVGTVDDLAGRAGRLQPPAVGSGEPALLQYTSGSTGDPKGVTLSHANLLANIRAMSEALAVTPEDVFVSWLPLYHDMGLIGAWLGSLHQATPLVIMSPLFFLARPARWLQAIHRYRGTLSGGPNFAYELLLRHVGDDALRSFDLSSWRVAFNGAEPVAASTLERFCTRFAAAGFRREAMAPVYGLAENCVGLAFPPLGRGPVIDRIRRDELARHGRALPADAADPDPVRVVACGQPLPGNDIRIVDAAGFELPDRREGRLQFRGPSATRGYWRNPEATQRLLHGEWRESGDLAYAVEGDVYVTSRAKDLIIRAGRNIHPADLEESVGAVAGVLPGRVAAFGCTDAASGTERLIVLAETRKRDAEVARLHAEINDRVATLAGAPPDEVVLAPPNSIPRTSSGKIRRGAARDLWRDGRLGQPERSRRSEALRLAAAAGRGRVRRLARAAAGIAFAGWAWAVVGVVSPIAWLGTLVLPHPAWRWNAMRWAARTAFGAAGTPLTVHGVDNLPAGPCVLVANHASYLDVLALIAALPRPVAFVAKAELRDAWFIRLPLDRIGTCFVERFDRKKGLEDYRRIAAVARQGRSPLFFPEGTFRRAPGLMPFRMGAFACAVDAGLPVVPISLRGTRAILRSGSWFPRRGAVTVTIAPPLPPEPAGNSWSAAAHLRERTRRALLPLVGEPDAREADPFAAAAAEARAPSAA